MAEFETQEWVPFYPFALKRLTEPEIKSSDTKHRSLVLSVLTELKGWFKPHF